jgi:hypothetical protein
MADKPCLRCRRFNRCVARGLCNACYKQASLDGTLETYGRVNLSPEEWLRRSRKGPDECWPWQGPRDRDGYGLASRSRAHRWAYVHLGGYIPDGLQLDHGCVNPPCVNPAHMSPMTGRDNVLRGKTLTAANLAKTRCIHGHEFTTANTYRPPGKPSQRQCRQCKADWQRKVRSRC